MKSIERGGVRESIDKAIASVANAYGFNGSPLAITKNDTGAVKDDADQDTVLIAALSGKLGKTKQQTQAWGIARGKGTSSIVFAVTNPTHSIAQAFVVKATLTTAEAAGLTDTTVLISSVGDQESRKRYLREAGNFFRKNVKDLPEELKEVAQKDPEEAMRTLTEMGHPLSDTLPRTIDFLSESSRKIMLETVSLLDTLEIPYELSNSLPYTPDVNKELIFAIEGTDKKGERVRIASGGRFEEDKKDGESIIGMAITVPETLGAREMPSEITPACFVVHIGEAAKMRAFMLLGDLWSAHVALNQALLTPSIQEQMDMAKASGAKFITIIGQREALDGTCIVKNTSTQLQETIPVDKMLSKLARVR